MPWLVGYVVCDLALVAFALHYLLIVTLSGAAPVHMCSAWWAPQRMRLTVVPQSLFYDCAGRAVTFAGCSTATLMLQEGCLNLWAVVC